MLTNENLDALRRLLCDLGDTVRAGVLAGRERSASADWSSVAGSCAADTIYAVDRIGEAALTDWFEARWPAAEPVELVIEGPDRPLCFPGGTDPLDTKWKCIIDPIDGTRGLMYDKRSGWVLAGLAPQLGPETMLSDIVVAAMTELPTTKQWRADQLSAVRGRGIVAESLNVFTGARGELVLRPSQATRFDHGFASIAKFFPEGRTLTAQIEEQLWSEIVGTGRPGGFAIFDDQYLSSAGQFYELLCGRDRFVADLRPLVHERLGIESALVCHPYDVATALLLEEAGIVYAAPFGGFPDAPLDTTSPVAWVACANAELAAIALPVLSRILGRLLA